MTWIWIWGLVLAIMAVLIGSVWLLNRWYERHMAALTPEERERAIRDAEIELRIW